MKGYMLILAKYWRVCHKGKQFMWRHKTYASPAQWPD